MSEPSWIKQLFQTIDVKQTDRFVAAIYCEMSRSGEEFNVFSWASLLQLICQSGTFANTLQLREYCLSQRSLARWL